MRRVLVAVDESEASSRAVAFVDAFFSRDGGLELLALAVARAPVPWVPPATAYGAVYSWPGPIGGDELQRDVAEEVQAEAQRTVQTHRPEGAEELVALGDPVDEIVRAAREHAVDLVVVGSGHKGVLERWFTGSVSESLVREGVVPVLVVP